MSLVVRSPNSLDLDKKSQKTAENPDNAESADDNAENPDNAESVDDNNADTNNTIKTRQKKSESGSGDSSDIARIKCSHSECTIKKLKLVDQHECRCGKIFCTAHRHSFDHNCTFDYKSHGRDIIQKTNIKVEGNKFKNGNKI